MKRLQARCGSCLVASMELRRSWRQLTPSGRYAGLKLTVGALLVGVYALVLGSTGYVWVTQLTVTDNPRPQMARAVTAACFGALVLIVVPRTVRKNGFPDAGAGLLTTAGHGTLVLGLLIAEIARFAGLLTVPLLGLALGVGLGSGSPLAPPAILLAAAATLTGAVTVGFAIGLLLKRIASTVAFLRRHRTALALSVSLALPLGYAVLLARHRALQSLTEMLAAVPASWPAEAILFAIGEPGVGLRAVAGVLLGLSLPRLSAPLLRRLAATAWFGDRPESPGIDTTTHRAPRLTRLPGVRSLPRESRAVALKSIRRATRAPFTVQYATIGGFALLAELQTIVATGRIPARLPVMVALVGAWTAGSLFALNPVGNEGRVLPATLSAAPSGREFLAGLWMASLAIAMPPTLVAVLLTGIPAPVGWPTLVVVLLATPILASGAVGIAAAVGIRYPKLRATAVGRGRQVVVPSPWAFGAFSALLLAAGSPAGLLAIHPVTEAGSSWTGLSGPSLTIAGVVSGSLLVAAGGLLGARHAAQRIETWNLA